MTEPAAPSMPARPRRPPPAPRSPRSARARRRRACPAASESTSSRANGVASRSTTSCATIASQQIDVAGGRRERLHARPESNGPHSPSLQTRLRGGACRARGKPTQGLSAPLDDRDGRHDRLLELLQLQHVFTSSRNRRGLIGSRGRSPSSGGARRPRRRSSPPGPGRTRPGSAARRSRCSVDRLPGVVALVVAARGSRPAVTALAEDVQRRLREPAGAERLVGETAPHHHQPLLLDHRGLGEEAPIGGERVGVEEEQAAGAEVRASPASAAVSSSGSVR